MNLHASAHALGIGTGWYSLSDTTPTREYTQYLLTDTGDSTPGTGYCEYATSKNVETAFQDLSGYTAAPDKTGCTAVPRTQRLDNGECGGHWQEACLMPELMTPTREGPTSKLSSLTTAGLRDIGYTLIADDPSFIDFTSADVQGPCMCPPTRRELQENVDSCPKSASSEMIQQVELEQTAILTGICSDDSSPFAIAIIFLEHGCHYEHFMYFDC